MRSIDWCNPISERPWPVFCFQTICKIYQNIIYLIRQHSNICWFLVGIFHRMISTFSRSSWCDHAIEIPCISFTMKSSKTAEISCTKKLTQDCSIFCFEMAEVSHGDYSAKIANARKNLPHERTIKRLYLLSYYLTDKWQLYFILY